MCAALAGCAPTTVRSPFKEELRAVQSSLEVENHYWADMTIAVHRGTQVIRLGQVTTNNRQTFTIPTVSGGAGASVYFTADPVGSRDLYRSPLVSLTGGDRYVWTLAVHIDNSTLVLR